MDESVQKRREKKTLIYNASQQLQTESKFQAFIKKPSLISERLR
jgi:hypothetical protein